MISECFKVLGNLTIRCGRRGFTGMGERVEVVKSVPLYSVINGFWINTTGENLEIVIRYKPQDWFEMGLGISGLTFVFCIFYLFYDWRKGKETTRKEVTIL